MEFHYPNGRKYKGNPTPNKNKSKKEITYSNRGMTLEDDLNTTNAYYLANNIAVIHKKPTPIQIVHVDYQSRSTAVIKEAYFRQASTTDYNGVWGGRYIDFEAKETKNTTSFPLNNFHDHQIKHMKSVVEHKGIAFVILRFVKTDELFLLRAEDLFFYWERMINGGRKSITKDEIIKSGYSLKYSLHPRIDYLEIVRHVYSL